MQRWYLYDKRTHVFHVSADISEILFIGKVSSKSEIHSRWTRSYRHAHTHVHIPRPRNRVQVAYKLFSVVFTTPVYVFIYTV
jgi:hypothetical protein